MRKLQKAQESVHCRKIITTWRRVVHEAKRTKEYFKVVFQVKMCVTQMHLIEMFRYYACLYVQRLEREIQESLNSEISQGNGQDRLSLLPNKLSLKVSLNLCDVTII